MTRKTTRQNGDSQLSRDLEKLQSDWERMDQAEPPDLLDRAVLNTARRELEPKNRSRPLKWLGGFATATVAVLAITVVWLPDQPADLPDNGAPGGPAARDKAATILLESEPEAQKATPSIEEQKALRLNAAPVPAAESPAPKMEARRAEPSDFMVRERDALGDEEALMPPEAWIKQLVALKQEGRIDELQAGLRAFREAYPDYPLPDSLGEPQP